MPPEDEEALLVVPVLAPGVPPGMVLVVLPVAPPLVVEPDPPLELLELEELELEVNGAVMVEMIVLTQPPLDELLELEPELVAGLVVELEPLPAVASPFVPGTVPTLVPASLPVEADAPEPDSPPAPELPPPPQPAASTKTLASKIASNLFTTHPLATT